MRSRPASARLRSTGARRSYPAGHPAGGRDRAVRPLPAGARAAPAAAGRAGTAWSHTRAGEATRLRPRPVVDGGGFHSTTARRELATGRASRSVAGRRRRHMASPRRRAAADRCRCRWRRGQGKGHVRAGIRNRSRPGGRLGVGLSFHSFPGSIGRKRKKGTRGNGTDTWYRRMQTGHKRGADRVQTGNKRDADGTQMYTWTRATSFVQGNRQDSTVAPARYRLRQTRHRFGQTRYRWDNRRGTDGTTDAVQTRYRWELQTRYRWGTD